MLRDEEGSVEDGVVGTARMEILVEDAVATILVALAEERTAPLATATTISYCAMILVELYRDEGILFCRRITIATCRITNSVAVVVGVVTILEEEAEGASVVVVAVV